MAVQSLIDIGFNYKKTEQDKDKVLAYLREVRQSIQDINGMQFNGGSLAGLMKNEEALTRVQEQLNKVTSDYVRLQEQVSKGAAAGVSNTNKQLDAFQQLNKEYKEAVANASKLGAELGIESQQFKDAAANAELLRQKIEGIKTATKAGGVVTAPPVIQSTTNLPDNGAADAANATGEAVSQLEKEQAAATIAAQEWAAAQQQAATAATASGAAITQQLTEYEALAQAIVTTQAGLDTLNAALKANATAFQQGLISEERFVEENGRLTIQQTELRQSLAATKAEFTSQAKIIAGTSGAYDMLNARYITAQKNAKDLAVIFGVDSVQAKAAAASAFELGQQLKTIDASTNQFQKNVGNYGSALTGAFSKGFGYLRQAAAILPGIGIAGIIGLISDKLVDLFAKFDLFKTKLTQTAEAGKTLQEAIGGTEYKKAVEEVERLTIDIDLAKRGFLEKSEVVKEYNDTLGKTTGQVTTLDEAEAKLIANKEAYVQMMLFKTAATLELQKAAESMAKAQEEANKKQEEFSSFTDVNAASAFGGSALTADQVRKQNAVIAAAQAERKNNAVKEQKDASDQSLKIAKDFEEKAAQISKDHKFSFLGEDKGATTNISQLRSYLQQLLKAQQEGEDLLLQDEIKFRQSIADSDKFSYEERQRQAQKASDLRIKLIKQNEIAELQQIQAARDESIKGYGIAESNANTNTKITADQRNKILTDAAQERNVAEQLYEQQRLNIITKANIAIKHEEVDTLAELGKLQMQEQAKQLAELAKGYADVHKNDYQQTVEFQSQTREGLINGLIEGEQKAYEKQQTLRTINFEHQKGQLEQQYNEGKISYTKYQIGLRDVETKYQKGSLEDQLASLKNSYAVYEKYGTTGSTAALKIKEAIEKTNNAILAQIELQKEANQQLSESLKQLGDEILNLGQAIGDASFQKQIDNYQKLIDASNKYYDTQISNIAESARIGAITDKEAADRTTVLNAEKAVKADEYDRKERELKTRQARFDKAASIARVVASTAEAIMKTYATFGFPLGTPLAIAQGAIGAVEVATILATPIPQYKDGLQGNKPAHIAIYGEAGPELIEKPGIAPYIADTATLDYLPANTRIKPIQPSDIDASMHRSMYAATAKMLQAQQPSGSHNGEVVKALHDQTRAIVRGYAKHKPKMPDMNELAKRIAFESYKRGRMNW